LVEFFRKENGETLLAVYEVEKQLKAEYLESYKENPPDNRKIHPETKRKHKTCENETY